MKSLTNFHRPQPHRHPAPAEGAATCTLCMTVDAGSVVTLRPLAMRVCGDSFEFMRVAMRAGGATRMRIWLCVRLSAAALLRANIVRHLPSARFDGLRIHPRAGT
ncbi:MAG TPA: hypothetical protein VIT92_14620 [Burkholderiaceae bacterium]